MKRIVVCILAMLACSAHASQYWLAGAFAPDVPANVRGVRATIEVEKMAGKSQKSAWLGTRVGNRWVQAGYKNWAGPKYVVECFTLINFDWTHGCPHFSTVYLAHPPMVAGTLSTFAIVNVAGTNLWQVITDGILTNEFDMGADFARSGQINIEQAPSTRPERFATVEFNPALEFLIDGIWTPPTSLQVGYPDFGVEGPRQNPLLPPNTVRMGSAIPLQPRYTELLP